MAEIVPPEVAALEAEPPKKESGGLPPEEGFEALIGPDPEEFVTSQGRFLLGPMTMDQLSRFLPHLKKMGPVLQAQITKGELDYEALAFGDYEGFKKLISLATNIPAAKLGLMFPNEIINICTKVVVSNLDFFVRTLPGVLGGARESIVAAVMRMVGASRSSSSLPQGTASQKSEATPSASSDSGSPQ